MSNYVENNEIMYGPYVIEDNNVKFNETTKKILLEKFEKNTFDNIEKVNIEHINTQAIFRNNKKKYAHEFKVIYIEKVIIEMKEFNFNNSYSQENEVTDVTIPNVILTSQNNREQVIEEFRQQLAVSYGVETNDIELELELVNS